MIRRGSNALLLLLTGSLCSPIAIATATATPVRPHQEPQHATPTDERATRPGAESFPWREDIRTRIDRRRHTMRVTAGLEAQRRRQEVVPRERVAPPQPLSSLEQRQLGDRATPLSTSPGGQAEDMAEPDRWRHPESRSTKSEAGDALPQTGIDRPRIAVLQRSMQAEVAAFVAGQRHRPRHPSAAARTLGLEVERRRLLRKLRAIRSGLPTPLSLPPPCTSSTR